MRNIQFRNYVSNISAQVLMYLIPLVTLPILINNLGVEDYGNMVKHLLIWQGVGVLIDYNFNTEGVQYIISSRETKDRLLRESTIFASKLILLLVGWIIIVAMNLLYFGEIDFFSVMCGISYTAFYVIANQMWYSVNEKFYIYSFLNILSRIVFLIMVFAFAKNLSAALLIQCTPVVFLGIFSAVASKYFINLSLSRNTFKQSLRYLLGSTNSFLASFFGYLLANITLYLGPVLLSPVDYGNYAILDRVVRVYLGVYSGLNQIIFRKTLSEGLEGMKKLSDYTKRSSIIVSIFYAFISIVGGIFLFFLGKKLLKIDIYQNAALFFTLSLWAYISILNSVFGFNFLQAIGEYALYSKLMTISLIITILLVIFLAHYFGASGIGAGVLVAELLLLAFVILTFSTRSKHEDILPDAR